MLISGSLDKSIRLWNVQEGRLIKTIHDDNDIENISLSPDGKILTSIG